MSERRDELTTDDLAGRMPAESASEEQQQESTAQEPEERTDVATAMREQTREENGSDANRASSMPLFPAEEGEQFRGRWSEIQAGFVDDPREMVERADHLVADLMQRLAAQFSEERGRLESQWDSDDDVSTEDLRVTLTRYRSFFERLLEA